MSDLYAFMNAVGETAVAWIRPDADRFQWTCQCQTTGTADTATAASLGLNEHRRTVHMLRLVLIVGPIASGKSTIANTLAARRRHDGRAVAVLDLDDVVDSIGGFASLTPDRLRQAQRALGHLVGFWLRRGVDVIAHGPFPQRAEMDTVLAAVPHGTCISRVLLTATYEAALERVTGDPDRALSRDPVFLRQSYQQWDKILPKLVGDFTYDTTTMSPGQIVEDLARVILE